jgi:NodT family efflux transporter outer membrane factor (OMF) lipoprotein
MRANLQKILKRSISRLRGREAARVSVLALPAAMILASCAVGPNFKKPGGPDVTAYTSAPLSTTVIATNVTGGHAQRFTEGADIAGDWWTLFHSKALNELIGRAMTHNPNIKAAQAALLVAQENTKVQRGGFWPAIAGSFSASRQHQSTLLAPVPNANVFTYNLFTPQVSVSYVPDVFGLNRRTVESLKAQEDQQRFTMIATCITLSANVVTSAIQEASLRKQIETTRQVVGLDSKALDVLRAQYSKGYANGLDLAAQESQLAQIETTLPPLLKQLAQQRDALAVLVGAFPSQEPAEKFELSDLALPQDLPLSLPSKLVEQRPDVRQAQEAWHSASAQVGVSIANRLPNITLTASAGSTALTLDKLFSSGTGFWSLGAAATQPIFQGGMLLHKERAAKAALVEAAEQYRATVQTAFQNVADTLNALEEDADALKTAANAEHAAKVTFELSRKQFQAGYAGYLSLLSAEQTYQQALNNLVQAQANRYSDTAALFLALGGGWWNRPDMATNQVSLQTLEKQTQ